MGSNLSHMEKLHNFANLIPVTVADNGVGVNV